MTPNSIDLPVRATARPPDAAVVAALGVSLLVHAVALLLPLRTPRVPQVEPPRPLAVRIESPAMVPPQPLPVAAPRPAPTPRPPSPAAPPPPPVQPSSAPPPPTSTPVTAIAPTAVTVAAAESRASAAVTADKPPASVAPSAAPSRPAPAPPVTAPLFDADYLHNPPPRYPSAAQRLRESGRVMLSVQVSAAGLPERVEVASSSGSPRLDQAALETVRRWRFVPAQQGGKAIAAAVIVPIVFRLEDAP